MKITIEGNEKKIKQLKKELKTRLSREKLVLKEVIDTGLKEEIETDTKEEKEKTKKTEQKKRGRKPIKK